MHDLRDGAERLLQHDGDAALWPAAHHRAANLLGRREMVRPSRPAVDQREVQVDLHAVAVDAEGNLYAGDIFGKRAQKFVRRR